MDKKNKQTMPFALKVVATLTGIWFICLFLLVEFSQVCDDAVATEWWELSARYISCRPLNEIGDFLAGAFAPVAFAWLVATVLIQAEELRAQRQELQYTRAEMKLAREVAGEQRDAMKSQAAELARQGKMNIVELKMREREEKDKEFEELIISFHSDILEGRIYSLDRKFNEARVPAYKIADFARSNDAWGMVRKLANLFERDGLTEGAPAYETVKNVEISRWCRRFYNANQDIDAFTPAMQTKIMHLKLNVFTLGLSYWSDPLQ